jgi:LmbE family N-acetylglucosaminyl deacetylase
VKEGIISLQRIFLILFIALAALAPVCALAESSGGIEPLITHATRLIVFSPHPDDESLGAGGLIQRVLEAGGHVKVVFVTSGDGFPEGVEEENHITHPTAKDYRKYGAERRIEALKATAVLGLKERDVVFLGFPDGGLSYLRLKFRSHQFAYRSPFTREDRPPAFERIIRDTDYTGQDLIKEMIKLIADFRPSLVVTTPAEDQHPDHNATFYFVKETLRKWNAAHPDQKPKVFTFLIHFGQWPIAQGAGTGLHLDPPDGFPGKTTKWISLPLTPGEIEIKRKAILEYHTQMLVMGRLLLSFARSNELWMPDE